MRVDVHSLLREAEAQEKARAEQLPTEQDCIRMMVQCRMRLLEIGWRSGEYAPRNGTEFEAIVAGFTGPSRCVWLGSGFFVADGGDWWPVARPMVYRPMPEKESR
ncbi:hypothetical protein ACFJIS_18850 [Variovorax boronicumulans]|uniref:hypothetical protein n=1 Tax=Variovorax boronicumulans TaxID=436515 RepID=UPI0036F26B92